MCSVRCWIVGVLGKLGGWDLGGVSAGRLRGLGWWVKWRVLLPVAHCRARLVRRGVDKRLMVYPAGRVNALL